MKRTERKHEWHMSSEGVVHDPNFVETTEGDAPSSIEVSTNAKGQAQFSVKLYYDSPLALDSHVENDLSTIIMRVRGTLSQLGIPLAGENTGTGK
jgi:hypothetical protein